MVATGIKLNWQDPYYSLGLSSKISLGLGIVLILGIGTIFHGTIITFEKNGGDPRKRGFLNRVRIVMRSTSESNMNFTADCSNLLDYSVLLLASTPDWILENYDWTDQQRCILDLELLWPHVFLPSFH